MLEGDLRISYSPTLDNKIETFGTNTLIQIENEQKDGNKTAEMSWPIFNSDTVVPCESPMEIDFGHVSLTQPKSATLVISNPNSVSTTWKRINQSKLLSAIKYFQIELVTIIGKSGKVLEPLWGDEAKISPELLDQFPEKPIPLLSHTGDKLEIIDLILLPFEEVHLRFTIQATDERTFKGVGTLATLEFAEDDASHIKILYKFKALEGQIEFKPEVMKFKPTF